MITEVYKGVPDTPELYVPQRRMLDAVEGARGSGVSSCYVDVATGVGKTYAVAHDIKKYLDEKPDARILYLCHKGQVLEQARETISEVVGTDVSHGNFYKNQYEDQEQVTYATFQQMGGKSYKGKNYHAFDPKEFDYIVVDEGHHGPAPTYTEVIEYFKPDFQIGLTATDERMDGKDISEVLGPKVFEYTLEEAIAEGVLVKPDYRLFTEHEADLKDLLQDDDVPPTLKEINDRLTRVQRDRNYQKAIVGEIQAAQAEHENPRTVIYCPDIQYADEFSELIPEGQSLHSGLTNEEQEARLKAFRRGEIPTLLVVDIFNEGIDVPEINTMVFLRGTESKMIFLQQLGRGLRTAEAKDKVIALDFAASWQRIMLIAELKDKVQTIYQGRKPRSSTANKHPRHKREYFGDDDMVPFEFSFSKDALDAVNIVEKIRNEKAKPKEVKNKGTWTEKWENADKALQEMFGLKPFDPRDPYNPRNLPNQRLTKAQDDSYARKIALGDKNAQEQYITHRLRYVYNRALTECGKQNNAGSLAVEDYFQKGLEELTDLLDKYDVDTYKSYPDLRAYMGIKLWNRLQKMSKNESTQVRVPIHVQQRVKKIQDAHKLFMKNSYSGREPLDAELAELIEGVSIGEIEQTRPWLEIFENGFDDIETISNTRDHSIGLIQEVSQNIAIESLFKMLQRLSTDEKRIITEYFGLESGQPKGFEDIARDIENMSKEEVRGVVHRTLIKLRKDPDSILLHEFDGFGETEHLAEPHLPPQSMVVRAKQRLRVIDIYSSEGRSLRAFISKWEIKNETPRKLKPKVQGAHNLSPAEVDKAAAAAARALKVEAIWKRHKTEFDKQVLNRQIQADIEAEQLMLENILRTQAKARQEEQKRLHREQRKREQEEQERLYREQRKREREERKIQLEKERLERKIRGKKRIINRRIKTASAHLEWLQANIDEQNLSDANAFYKKLIEDLEQELDDIDQSQPPTV